MSLSTNHPAPACNADYPIRQSEEHRVTRRQFAKFTCCSALAFGAVALSKDKLFPPPIAKEPMRVASQSELKVGGYKLFNYPTANQPCILIRLSETEFAAYSQSCTHLQCPVHYQHEAKKFYCPCHEGFFSADDGRVLAGPPPRPLPRYPVELRRDEIWVLPAPAKTAQA